MAGKGSNFRGTRRTLYTPRTVKYISEKEARREYQSLRRVAMKRMARLEKSGVQQPYTMQFPPSSMLTADQIAGQLLDVSTYLRDPRSFVTGARQFEERQLKAFEGSPVIQRDLKAFGDFMEDMRKRANGQEYESDRTRAAYESAVSKGMRPATLEKHFSDYLIDKKKAEQLSIAADSFTGRRLTIAELKKLLEK